MKHILKYSLGCLALVATALMTFSCIDEDAASNLPSAIYPGAIEIKVPAELEPLIYYDKDLGVKVLPLIRGEEVTLGYTISPDNVTFDDVNWTSSNVKVATVDENNKLTDRKSVV